MRTVNFLFFIGFFLSSCHTEEGRLAQWVAYDETEELQANQEHPVKRMRYKEFNLSTAIETLFSFLLKRHSFNLPNRNTNV